jgi:hypothetical protein
MPKRRWPAHGAGGISLSPARLWLANSSALAAWRGLRRQRLAIE